MVHPLFNFRAILYISFITVIIKLFKKKREETPKKFKVKIKIKGDINELNNQIQQKQQVKKEEHPDNEKKDYNDNINITATSNKLTLEEKKKLLDTSLWDENW